MSSKANKYLLLVFTLILMSSCGAKKKMVQKSEFSTEIAQVERVSELSQNDIQTDLSLNASSQKLTEKEAENFNAEIDDPTKKASITKKEKDGETVWELDNIKNFNSGKEKSKEQSKDSISEKQSLEENSKTAKESELELDAKASGSSKDIDIEKDGKFPWWILIVLAVLTILYIWYSRIKKTYMPWKWFST